MPALTVVLNAYSIAYPTISNRIRVDISKQSDPLAIVVSEIDAIAGHPARIWSFPGLERTNYIFTMNEIDGSGNSINNLAYFDVVPDAINGALVRDDEQIFPDITPGFVSGATEIYFDGGEVSSGSGVFRPDYRGWNINPERRDQPGTMIRDQEYEWNTLTGYFHLLTEGDVFVHAELFNIDFDPIENVAGGSVPTASGFSILLKTANYYVSENDFSKKLICEPSSDFMVLTLPDISLVTEGEPLMIEVYKTQDCCVKFLSEDPIKFARGFIYLCRNESLRIYKYQRSGSPEYRVDSNCSNILTVGSIVSHYQISSGVFNAIPLDGSSISVEKYARLYYEYVSRLPLSQVVSYDNWAIGNNKYHFSSANDSGEFRIPDISGLYERSTATEIAGTYWRMMIEKHKHMTAWNDNPGAVGGAPFGDAGYTNKPGNSGRDNDNDWWFTNDGSEIAGANAMNSAGVIGTETRPNSFSINKYILV